MTNWKSAGQLAKAVRWTEAPEPGQEDKTSYFGEEIEGLYERKRENVGANNANIYEIRHETHGLIGVWGSTVLNDKFSEIPVGSTVKIVHKGRQKPKTGAGKPYHVFEVMYMEPQMKVAGAPVEDSLEDDGLPPM